MKKLFAVILATALILSLSVSAFALGSPEAEPVHKIHIINGDTGEIKTITVKDGESITVTADSALGVFDSWNVYSWEGGVATLGQHYGLGQGQTLESSSITLFPLTDLIITGNYNDKVTPPNVGQNGEQSSPQTGDMVPAYLAAIMLLSLSGMLIVKKQAVR